MREEEKNSGGVLERYAHISSGRCFVQDTKGALGRRTCIDLFICFRSKRPKAAGELPDTMFIWLQLKPVTYHLCQLLINISTLLLTKVTRPRQNELEYDDSLIEYDDSSIGNYDSSIDNDEHDESPAEGAAPPLVLIFVTDRLYMHAVHNVAIY